ncbi:hypothetical protein K4084_003103 [Escherichia coli]|nr:hypothetical protein [Escherichia coli]EHY7554967.1 hypothetical protein [Escherichia coli]
MHRIDTKTAQKDKFGAGKNGFTRGNPQTGTPATDLDDDYFDMLQEELCSVVEASGASLEKGRHDQLLTALRALLLSRKNPFGDIKSDGTVKTALENLGLGEIATVADIQAGTASKLVDAEGLKKYLPTKVMQASGFIRIPDVPGGTIIQWGQVTGTINEGTKNVVLPTPFPNSGRFAIAIPLNLAGDTTCDIFAQLQSASLTGINFFFSWVSSSTPANGFQWFAIGY